MKHQAEYNGWTNWETWNTALIMGNEEWSYNEALRLVERYDYDPGKGVWALRDWAIENIIGPTNQQALEDARGWNDIPEAERLDYHYEDLKERNPQAADLVSGLGFGPDVSDYTPNLIDPELVNWEEIYESYLEDIGEEVEYEDPDAPGETTFPSNWVSKYASNIQVGASPLDYGSAPYSRLFIAGEPYESKHPYFRDGVQAFLDYYPGEDGIYIGFVNVNQSFEGQGLARALLEDLYQRYPDKRIVWGRTMDDRIDHLKADFQQRFPERTASMNFDEWAQAGPSTYDYASRRPWWVDPQTNEVYVGEQGSTHPQDIPYGWIKGEYWPQTGEFRATNVEDAQAEQYIELVRQQLFPPMVQDESPMDKAMRQYQERTADADGWAEPAMTNVNEWVEIPGEAGTGRTMETGGGNSEPCPHCGRPNVPIYVTVCPDCGMRIRPGFEVAANFEGAPALYGDPDPSNNWLYLNGKVAMGDTYWALAQKIAEEAEMSQEEIRFITNQVARNHLPPDWDVAFGEIDERGMPRIWASTVDRNHVWDVVKEAVGGNAPV